MNVFSTCIILFIFIEQDYKTKLQRGQVICPRSYNHWKIKL